MLPIRKLKLNPKKNYLLLGPRRVGKSTYLKRQFSNAEYIDLLKTDVFYDYRARPALLRERYLQQKELIIIDEIQKIPDLIHEVHWLIENSQNRFILSGSSARKLKHHNVSNLAGRLSSVRMFPFTADEIPKFNLLKQLQFGGLPPIVFSEEPWADLKDYCGEYLHEEIQNEGVVRNIPGFSRFLETAALSNAQTINYANIARDCAIGAKTVKEYFQILEDTLIGYHLQPWFKSRKRRAIQIEKFYFFDCGVVNFLLNRTLSPKTPEFGQSFEQWLILEVIAQKYYGGNIRHLHFWRSASGYEVDLLIDEHTAVEFKAGPVSIQDAKGILALAEEIQLKHRWIVCLEEKPRRLEHQVEVMNWKHFLERVQEF